MDYFMIKDRAWHGVIGATPLLFAIVYLWNPWGQRGLVVEIVLYSLAVGAVVRNPFMGKPRSALAVSIAYALSAAILIANEVVKHNRRGIGWVFVLIVFAIVWGNRFDRERLARDTNESNAVIENHG